MSCSSTRDTCETVYAKLNANHMMCVACVPMDRYHTWKRSFEALSDADPIFRHTLI